MPQFPPGVHLRGGAASAPINRAAAKRFYAPIIPIVVEMRRNGLSLRAIARELECRGIKMRSEFEVWNACQVRRVLLRAEAEAGKGTATADAVSCGNAPAVSQDGR